MEFALATPVFFMLTVGVIDVGRAFFDYNSMSHAAREAARFAAVQGGSQNPSFNWVAPFNGNTPGVYSTSTGHPIAPLVGTSTIVGTAVAAAPGLDVDDLTVTIGAPGPTGPSPNSPISVRMDYAFQPGTSLIIGGIPITLTASSEMIIE